MLSAFDEYCLLIASLPDRFPYIQSSTLTAYTIDPYSAEVTGQVIFAAGYVLNVWELLDLHTRDPRARNLVHEIQLAVPGS